MEKNVHFARTKDSPGKQISNATKSVHSEFHHRVLGTRLGLHRKMAVSRTGRSREPTFYILMDNKKIKYNNANREKKMSQEKA